MARRDLLIECTLQGHGVWRSAAGDFVFCP